MEVNRKVTAPLGAPRTLRGHGIRALTSMPMGKVVPICAVPLLREDAIRRGALQLAFELQETAEILMNTVFVDVKAYLVPWLAMERFGGSRDIFDRSYMGVAPFEGEDPIDFFETEVKGAYGAEEIYEYMGVHAKPGAAVNTMYAEAYNAIWNFRAANRSPHITPRGRLEKTLAPAFWAQEQFPFIVPTFDQAVMDGEVALNVIESQLALSAANAPVVSKTGAQTAWKARDASNGSAWSGSKISLDLEATTGFLESAGGSTNFYLDPGTSLQADLTGIVAEMEANGITISLSNIDMARKTQAFARMRERYAELDEEWVVDMLMSGMSIPDQALKQPILIGQARTAFGQSKRYSTDSGALAESAVNGGAMASLRLNVPRIATGGVVMVTAEATPEQLYERQKDPFFYLGDVADLPDYLRDELDPEKVSVVTNDFVDVDHATPNATFGFAPLNHEWSRKAYNIGGKFYRPDSSASFVEDRQRLYAVESADPVLSEDFYICTNIHQDVFLDTEADPVEVVAVGECIIEGHTVFGPVLVEALNNYQAVLDKVPQERIDQEA